MAYNPVTDNKTGENASVYMGENKNFTIDDLMGSADNFSGIGTSRETSEHPLYRKNFQVKVKKSRKLKPVTISMLVTDEYKTKIYTFDEEGTDIYAALFDQKKKLHWGCFGFISDVSEETPVDDVWKISVTIEPYELVNDLVIPEGAEG